MNYLLLILATLASTTKALVCKKIGMGAISEGRVLRENSMIFLFASVAVIAMSPLTGGLHISGKTLLIALIFAVSLLFTQLMQMYAMRHGPASITTLIYSFGFLVPIIYGYAALGEPISIPQLIGIIVAALSLFFITDPKRDRASSRIWLILSFLAALGSGINAVIQKLHRTLAPETEISALLVISFLLASLISFALSFAIKCDTEKDPPLRLSLGFTAFSGVAIGGLNILNLLIAGRLPAVIQFPVYNIGSMILVGIGGAVFYGDRLSPKQAIGFLIGAVAILIIGLL